MALTGLALTSLLAWLLASALAKKKCPPDVTETGGLKLTFSSGPIGYNQLVERPKVLKAPTLQMTANSTLQGKKLLVVMGDPDAPGLANCTYWLHWLISGIFTQNGTLSKISTSVAYVPPTPPADTGIHRYQVLVYKMNNGTKLPHISQHANFTLNNTVKGLGKAVASTQFRVQHPKSDQQLREDFTR